MSDQRQHTKRMIKESMSHLKERRNTLMAKNKKEPNSYLSFFDKKIFFPERRKLREECGELGHDFIAIPHITSGEYDMCCTCDITRRKQNHVVS